MRLVISIMLGFLSICFNLAECCAASVSEIRAAIDGAYVLEEWYTADRVFRPPQVEGRVVFLNGAVVTILIDNGIYIQRRRDQILNGWKTAASVASIKIAMTACPAVTAGQKQCISNTMTALGSSQGRPC
jgi:hypothetical protein